jgi:hypothetical protein
LSYWYPRRWWRRCLHPSWYGWSPQPYPPYPYPAYPPISPEEELKMLEEYKKNLEDELKDIEEELKGVEARIEELRRITKK